MADPTRWKPLVIALAEDGNEAGGLLGGIGAWLVDLVRAGAIDEREISGVSANVRACFDGSFVSRWDLLDRHAADVRRRDLASRERMRKLRIVLTSDPRLGKKLLLEIINDPSEPDDILDEAGAWLTELLAVGLFAEWELANISPRVEAMLIEPP